MLLRNICRSFIYTMHFFLSLYLYLYLIIRLGHIYECAGNIFFPQFKFTNILQGEILNLNTHKAFSRNANYNSEHCIKICLRLSQLLHRYKQAHWFNYNILYVLLVFSYISRLFFSHQLHQYCVSLYLVSK